MHLGRTPPMPTQPQRIPLTPPRPALLVLTRRPQTSNPNFAIWSPPPLTCAATSQLQAYTKVQTRTPTTSVCWAPPPIPTPPTPTVSAASVKRPTPQETLRTCTQGDAAASSEHEAAEEEIRYGDTANVGTLDSDSHFAPDAAHVGTDLPSDAETQLNRALPPHASLPDTMVAPMPEFGPASEFEPRTGSNSRIRHRRNLRAHQRRSGC